jgi:hypothetical protein
VSLIEIKTTKMERRFSYSENTDENIFSVIKNEPIRSFSNDQLYKAYPIMPVIPTTINPCLSAPPIFHKPKENSKRARAQSDPIIRSFAPKKFRLDEHKSKLSFFHKKFALGKRKYLEVKRASSIKKRVSLLRSKLKSSSHKVNLEKQIKPFIDNERMYFENLAAIKSGQTENLATSVRAKHQQNVSQFYVVEIRAVFLKVENIDSGKFRAEAFIEARWVDFELEPSQAYDSNLHWNPKLYILNGLGETKQEVWYNQLPLKNENGSVRHHFAPSADCTIANEKFKQSEQKCSNSNLKATVTTGSVICERWRICGEFRQTYLFLNSLILQLTGQNFSYIC